MNHDLIERYIYAATKRLSRKQRDDVAQELRGLIDDMLNERCGEVTPTEKDIRVVLTELGTPQELSAQYDEDAKKCLIGQPYYSTYRFVLKIVLLAATGGITIANLMLQMVEPQEWFAAITGWLVMVYNCLLAAFTIVTLLFAFFYHKGVQITEPFNFDNLPPVPKRTQEITKWECIAGIVFCVLFAVLFLVVPQILGIIIDVNGQKISLFEVSALQGTWYIILAFAACGIIRESVQLVEGRYNKRVLTTSLISNVISAFLSIWWLTGFELIHPDFLANIPVLFEGENAIVINLFSNFQIFFLIVMLFALILDSIDVTVKTLRK
ncbi:MAG: hypothetical protein J6C04_08025 [Oscillospiraceae bacterium]|nr:hypothetical protein [Oscillospiraceae bacterium]MBQ2837756.1 hypothetical protein [Peptococcaceae bacterium]